MRFKIGEEYFYGAIDQFAQDNHLIFTEYGKGVHGEDAISIGEQFIVLTQEDSDTTYSFIATSYRGGMHYRCIYKHDPIMHEYRYICTSDVIWCSWDESTLLAESEEHARELATKEITTHLEKVNKILVKAELGEVSMSLDEMRIEINQG